MSTDLTTLKENQLKKYSYEDTLKIVSELESSSISQYTGIAAVEISEQYYSFASIINNRIINNEFPELKLKIKKNEKEILQHRVTTLLSSLKYSLDLGKLEKRVKEVDTLKLKIDRIDADYQEKAKKIDDSITEFKKRIDESESKILSNVLAIMGVFSAIITIILSIIITSSSWLNNADGASAIIAFVVPSLVSLLVAFVLLSLVFSYINKDTNGKGEKLSNQKYDRAFKLSICGILIITSLCCWLCLSSNDKAPTHIRYIILPNQYNIVEDDIPKHQCSHHADCTCNKIVETKLFYEFIIEDRLYRFEYNENLLHDGNLHFCAEHEVLE